MKKKIHCRFDRGRRKMSENTEKKSESLLFTFSSLVRNQTNFKLKLVCEDKLNILEGYRLQFLVEECDNSFYVGKYVHTYSNKTCTHLIGKRVMCINEEDEVIEDNGKKKKETDESQLIVFPVLALNPHNFRIRLVDEKKISAIGDLTGYRYRFLVEECDIAAYVGTCIHTYGNESGIHLMGKRVRCSVKDGLVEDNSKTNEEEDDSHRYIWMMKRQ